MKLPAEFEKRMREMLKDEYGDFVYALEHDPIYKGIRINTLKAGAGKAVSEQIGNADKVPWCDCGFYVDKNALSGKHPFHMSGLVYFQEPSAMSAGGAAKIEKGNFVLDLCAAPGGKATHAAQLLDGSGLLVANEIVPKRAKILAENIQRMGIKNALVTNESPERLAEKYPCFFDRIIVDAPCSGEGMFRKEPQAAGEWSVEHTTSCGIRQKNILKSAVKMLKKGGKLVYSTCTFAPCENEGIVDFMLKEYDDLHLENITLEGMSDANSNFVGSDTDMSDAKRIYPHRSRGEGHFIALFGKDGEDNTKKAVPVSEKGDILYREFEKEYLNVYLDGKFIKFGDRLYLLPYDIDTDKIKIELAGLFLGICKKGRFEPSHALCLALKSEDFKNTFETGEWEKYYHGDVFECEKSGWTAVLYKGYPIGWGKASCGILKNHFPKYLRF